MLLEEAVADVEGLNASIAAAAQSLFDRDATTGDVPSEPSDGDRRDAARRVEEFRRRRDQLEERLMRLLLP